MTKEEVIDRHFPLGVPFTENSGNHDFDLLHNAMDEYAKSWRDRCLAAEDYIAKSPCDPDITERQRKAYEKWQRHVEGHTDAEDELAEYAKQQAIAFDEWKLKNNWLWDNSRTVYFNFEGRNRHETRLTIKELYDQFIEQQSKNR